MTQSSLRQNAAPGRPGALPADAPSLKERAVATGQAALITAGLVLLQGWLVLPLTVSRIVDARRRGERAAKRFRVGAWIGALQLVLAVAFWAAVARTGDAEAPEAALDAFFWTLAAVCAAILLISGLRLAVAWLRRPGTDGAATRPQVPSVDRALFDRSDASRSVEDSVRRLASYAALYDGHRLGAGPAAAATSERIARIVSLSQELFRRLNARGTEQQTRIAKARYADILGKVALVVAPEYLGDVIDHPELWHHPEQRVLEVATALDDVENQLLENIRQVNAATDLDFQVALSSLATITGDNEFQHLYGEAL